MLFPGAKPTAVTRAPRSEAPQRFPGLAAATAVLLIASFVSIASGPAAATSSGTLSLAPSSATLARLASTRINSRTVVNLKVPTSLPFRAAIQLRSASEGSGYRTSASISSTGGITVTLSRVSNGVETALGASQSGLTAKPGQTIRLQGAIAGSTPVRLYVRVWLNGTSAPRWQLAVLDYAPARIRTLGTTRLWGSLLGTAWAPAHVSFSKVSTVKTSVASVRSYKVKAWVPASPVATPTTPTPTPTPTVPVPVPVKPSAATTGVKAGTVLTRHDGDLTITVDGTVLNNLDIHGFVIVRAKNVTISNSIVRGGPAKGIATGLITNYAYPGLLVVDTTIEPEFRSVWFDGIKGSGYTARRVHVIGGVDSMKVQGDNVTIEDSLLENTDYYANDPQQSGGPTHNDNVQIQNGQNINITGNTIRGATNFAVLGSATMGNTHLVVANNWLDGGHCTLKLSVLNGWTETATVTGNKFGPNRAVSSCPFTSYPAVTLTHNTNTFENTGAPITPLVVVS